MPRRPEIETRDGILIVTVVEDLDIASAGSFVETTLGAVPNDAVGVIVDLTASRYVDSAGIRALFKIGASVALRQQVLKIVIPPDAALRKIVGLVQLDTTAELFERLDEALSAVEAA